MTLRGLCPFVAGKLGSIWVGVSLEMFLLSLRCPLAFYYCYTFWQNLFSAPVFSNPLSSLTLCQRKSLVTFEIWKQLQSTCSLLKWPGKGCSWEAAALSWRMVSHFHSLYQQALVGGCSGHTKLMVSRLFLTAQHFYPASFACLLQIPACLAEFEKLAGSHCKVWTKMTVASLWTMVWRGPQGNAEAVWRCQAASCV